MGKRHGWLIGLVVVALLVVACGPQMATPTPDSGPADVDTGTSAAGSETSESPPAETGELPVDPDDWHVLGAPDASVVIVEYSDFQ